MVCNLGEMECLINILTLANVRPNRGENRTTNKSLLTYFWYIQFAMYIDIHYVYIESKLDVLKKSK